MSREKKRKIDSESVLEIESDSQEMQERGKRLLERFIQILKRCASNPDDKNIAIV